MKKLIAIVCILTMLLWAAASTAAAADGITRNALEARNIPVSQKIALLNSASLKPVKTNYAPLDDLVSKILSEILTDGMSTYEKVRACFQYLMEGTTYTKNPEADQLYYTIWQTVNYKEDLDRNVVCEAYGMLTDKKGVCNHYASAMMVLARAIGLEAFIITCGDTVSVLGSGDHYGTMLRLQGKYYLIDPSLNVVWNMRDELETSVYFCTPVTSDLHLEYCNIEEQLASYGGFQYDNGYPVSVPNEEIPGKTEGDVHYSFGSYPQSRVTDPALLAALNSRLDKAGMKSYRYSTGTGAVGTQKEGDYMRWADVSYGGARYRAVTFSSYRPAYTFYTGSGENSMQDENGYNPNEVYWFRFDPIDWRLIDGNSLLVSDFLLDAQPFNENIYSVQSGKEIDGKKYYAFADRACTVPVNDWSRSSLRRWLNEDFYQTAFSQNEKAAIQETTVVNNGAQHRFDYADSRDKVFLLSYNEIMKSDYIYASDASSRVASGSDYAKCQGLIVESGSSKSLSCWLLRSAGYHSDDICMVTRTNSARMHLSAATVFLGIRPAIRVSPSVFNGQPLEAPRQLKAVSTDSKQITLTVTAVNGADGYRFYMTPGKGAAEEVLDSQGTVLTVDNLQAGVTYTFRATACRNSNGKTEESAPTSEVSVLCHAFVTFPRSVEGKATGTGQVTLAWDMVKDAETYNIYRYVSADKMEVVARTVGNYYDVSGLYPGYTYVFRISAVSADGYESKPSETIVRCYCGNMPGSGRRQLGDVDFSGKVESGDARIVLRVSVDLERMEKGTDVFLAADADKNGKVEAADARLILRASVGLEQLT